MLSDLDSVTTWVGPRSISHGGARDTGFDNRRGLDRRDEVMSARILNFY
jgi:hypothetical protein